MLCVGQTSWLTDALVRPAETLPHGSIILPAFRNTGSQSKSLSNEESVDPRTVCLPPYQPVNGGYTCHPAPCRSLSHATVIEYFCAEGFILKGDYKYLTCLNGEWDDPMQISCLMDGGKQGTVYLVFPLLSFFLLLVTLMHCNSTMRFSLTMKGAI